MIGQTIGRYRIHEKLGEGGMGSVWLAEDPLLSRKTAVKFLSPALGESEEGRRRFVREARAACALSHPGIAAVYDAGEEDGKIYIAFEYIDGETISDLVKRDPLPVDRAVRLVREMAEALEHAHVNGTLHRDVTSRNIMVRRDGRAVVVDFGLALPENETRITKTGSTLGTIGYLAPEVARGLPGDRRADLYSLGVVLYEMLTGRLPFEAERAEAVLYAVVNEPVEPPSARRSEVSEDVSHVVLKALAKDPDHRYPSMSELIEDLRRVERGESVEAPTRAALEVPPPTAPMSDVPQPQRSAWIRNRATLVAASLTTVLAAVMLARTFGPFAPRAPDVRFASVAVLPLVNQSDDPAESDHWAKGISETIATKLTGVSDVRVGPWVSSQGYSVATLSPQVICEELNVEAVVVGTFRLSGELVQGSVALVDGSDGTQVWADQFREPLSDVLRVQSRIAVEVARELKGSLSGEEENALEAQPAQSVEAYEFYLRGSAKLHEQTHAASVEALELFKRALEIDSQLAPAHVGIGAVYSDWYFFGWQGGLDVLDASERSFRDALAIVPESPQALRGLTRIHWQRGRGLENLRLARRIRESRDELGVEQLWLVAEAYLLGGLPSEAVPVLREVLLHDPVNVGAHWGLVIALTWSGRFEEAIEAGEDFLMKFPEDPEVHIWLGVCHENLSREDLARIHYERAFAISPEDSNRGRSFLGHHLADHGEWEKAEELLAPAVARQLRVVAAHPDHVVARVDLALIYIVLPELGDFASQARVLEEIASDNDWVASHLAYGYAQLKDYDGAARVLRQQLANGFAREHVLRINSSPVGTHGLLDLPEHAQLRQDYVTMLAELSREYGTGAFTATVQ